MGQPRRLSVDLDFNYVGHLEREIMLADRPQVEDASVRFRSWLRFSLFWITP